MLFELEQIDHRATVEELIEILKQFSNEDKIDLRGSINIERINDTKPLAAKKFTISINREITNIPDEVCKYDNNGYLIYRKSYEAKEEWIDYDTKGNKIHYKNSDGFEEWYEYNDKNQCIHSYTEKNEYRYEYNENGEEIKCSNTFISIGRFQQLRNNSVKQEG